MIVFKLLLRMSLKIKIETVAKRQYWHKDIDTFITNILNVNVSKLIIYT